METSNEGPGWRKCCWGAQEGVFWEDFTVKESQEEREASGRWRTEEQHSREREQQGKGLAAGNSIAFWEDDVGGVSRAGRDN